MTRQLTDRNKLTAFPFSLSHTFNQKKQAEAEAEARGNGDSERKGELQSASEEPENVPGRLPRFCSLSQANRSHRQLPQPSLSFRFFFFKFRYAFFIFVV
jgi:hypothetical protein